MAIPSSKRLSKIKQRRAEEAARVAEERAAAKARHEEMRVRVRESAERAWAAAGLPESEDLPDVRDFVARLVTYARDETRSAEIMDMFIAAYRVLLTRPSPTTADLFGAIGRMPAFQRAVADAVWELRLCGNGIGASRFSHGINVAIGFEDDLDMDLDADQAMFEPNHMFLLIVVDRVHETERTDPEQHEMASLPCFDLSPATAALGEVFVRV